MLRDIKSTGNIKRNGPSCYQPSSTIRARGKEEKEEDEEERRGRGRITGNQIEQRGGRSKEQEKGHSDDTEQTDVCTCSASIVPAQHRHTITGLSSGRSVVCRLIHLRLVQYGFNVCLLRFVCDAALDDVDQVLCCRVQMSMILKLSGDGERAVRGVCGLETRDTDGLAMPVCVSGNRL